MTRMHLKTTLSVTALTLAGAFSGMAQGADYNPGSVIDLLTTPPELTAKVAPNVVLTFDDSASMARINIPDARPYDQGTPWTNGNSYPGDSNSPWVCAGVINPGATAGTLESLPMNGVFYNKNATYAPPLYQDGTSFPDARFTAAWDDGILHNRPTNRSNSTTRNLTTYSRCGKAEAGYFYYAGPTLTPNANGKIANTGDLYKTSNWKWQKLPTAEQQNFANWYSYYRTRRNAAVSATSHAFTDFDGGIRIAWQILYNNSPRVSGGTTILSAYQGSTRVDFYNWLFNVQQDGSNTPNVTAAKRVGDLFKYGAGRNNTTNPYWDASSSRELSCRKNFSIHVTDGFTNESSRPLETRDTAGRTLPDGRSYSTSEAQSSIFWNEDGANTTSFADLAFHYWATDLRPDFQNNVQTKLKVRPYLADRTTGVTGNTPLLPGDNWLDNKEVFWNPANNPATWPHLVQYIIGFGVDGTLPRIDATYEKLRKGGQKWPAYVNNNIASVDDMWHAAVNSRGEFFSAGSPDDLILAMRKVIASVVAQSTSSTPAAVSIPIMTGGNSGYQGGYDSSGWSGSLRRREIDITGEYGDADWDASCLLTGGQCADPVGSSSARDPNSRIIFTSNDAGSGVPFKWASLDGAQQTALNPSGSQRVSHIRGDRSYESSTTTPALRTRTSVLGAIVNGEPAYVSAPRSGYHDIFPAGSPEQTAAAADEGDSYAGYQNAQRGRAPMVYAGSNDGMLHAFDAVSGVERWAYIPSLLITNGRLKAGTERVETLIPGVDSPAREADVFINGKWRTILLGSLRLGGRGIYALDVSNPNPGSEAAVTGMALWEFTSGTELSDANDPVCSAGATSCASLGYTYDSANVARLRYDNKWVAVVSSGYFPDKKDAAATATDVTEAAAARTSLLVIDLETGELIREIRTSSSPQTKPAGFKTFGLSTPMVYDEGSDEVDDVVYAGDLAGNLWRFDLSDADKANWKVDLMFTTYGNGGATTVGDQPIAFNPTALRDPNTRRSILVVGTGKYFGEGDRTSAIPEQAWYGIRDYGTASSYYPIKVNQLVTQTLSQTGDDRKVSMTHTAPTGTVPGGVVGLKMQNSTSVVAQGWRIRLNIAAEKGERAQRRAIPLVTANVGLLYGLIPKSDDPCDPGARYSIMAINGANGGPISDGLVGGVAKSPSPPADPTIRRGGQRVGGDPDDPDDPSNQGTSLIIPGLSDDLSDEVNALLSDTVPPWHRGAWRDLLEW